MLMTRKAITQHDSVHRRTAQDLLLESDAGAPGDQEVVGEALHNHRTLALLDNIRQHGECRR
jgi:hypothetical protein